jgi:adenylate cyclase
MPQQQPWKRRIWRWRGILIAAPSASAIVIGLRLTGLLQGLEWAALDQFTRTQPVVKDDRIVIVEFRESDKKYGHPLPDQTLATLLQKIKQQQPIAIGLDLYRDIPVGAGYRDLVKVFQSTPNLIGIQKVGGTVDLAAIAPPPELAKLGQIAANDMIVDGDGKLRRGLLFTADQDNNNLPTLGMALALFYLQKAEIAPDMPDANTLKLGKTTVPLFHGNDGGYVRADDQGYQLFIHNRIRSDSFQRYAIAQVLEGKVPKNWARDRIVLIGPTAESLNDFFFTPSSYAGLFESAQRIPGVHIHAQLTSQLLSATLDDKPFLTTLPDRWENLWIAAWATIGALAVWQLRYNRHRDRQSAFSQSARRGVSIVLAVTGLTGGVYLAYLAHLWLPLVPALMSLIGSAVIVTAYQAQTTTELRKTLGRYLTTDVVASLLENPEGITLTGETRKITTLISDIRGFTSLSERYPAEKIVQMLNLYLAVMTKVIQHYGGTINDLTGDGIIVFFGAPLSRSHDTECAVACALAMQAAMTTVNQQNQPLGFPNLEMGIGLNTGEVVVGNIGSEGYLKYTAIGSHVNLAARVESFTVGGQVLITASTLADVAAIIQITGETEAQMKGVAKPVKLYDVSGIAGSHNIFLNSAQTAPITQLEPPLKLHYGLLDGKHMGDQLFTGEIIALAGKEAQIRSAHCPKVLSNLKLELNDIPAEIYAKVIQKPAEQASHENQNDFWIRFTMIPDHASKMLEQLQTN